MIPCCVGMKKRGLSAPPQSSYTANLVIISVSRKHLASFLVVWPDIFIQTLPKICAGIARVACNCYLRAIKTYDMRTKRSSSSNMRFLKGNVIFFALLLLVIMLFSYYALQGADAGAENNAACRVSFGKEYAGGECRVYLDDSLLYAGAALPSDSFVVMKRYAAPGSRVSLYTSKSLLKVVAGGDTVVRALNADRVFCIETVCGKVIVNAVE